MVGEINSERGGDPPKVEELQRGEGNRENEGVLDLTVAQTPGALVDKGQLEVLEAAAIILEGVG